MFVPIRTTHLWYVIRLLYDHNIYTKNKVYQKIRATRTLYRVRLLVLLLQPDSLSSRESLRFVLIFLSPRVSLKRAIRNPYLCTHAELTTNHKFDEKVLGKIGKAYYVLYTLSPLLQPEGMRESLRACDEV